MISDESRDSKAISTDGIPFGNTQQARTVYHDAILGIPRDSRGEIALPRVPTRPKSKKCSNCAWSTYKAIKHPNVIYTMRRLYIKERRGWKPIGWYCKNCGSVVLDELKAFSRTPDPTITALVKSVR